MERNPALEGKSMGRFMSWLVNDENVKIFGMKLPTGFQLIGQTKLKDYQAWVDYFNRQSKVSGDFRHTRITKRAYSRVGVWIFKSNKIEQN